MTQADPLARLENLLPESKDGKNSEVVIHPGCKVCNAPNNMVKIINYLLATGSTYADVERMIEPMNAALPDRQRVTYQNIAKHQKNHLPYNIDAVRRILERRAQESQRDFERGSDNLVSAASYAEVMMKKGFESLAEGKSAVSASDGLKAAEFLHRLEQESAGQESSAETLATLNRIIQAIRAVVPEMYWQRIMSHLDGEQEAIESSVEEAEFDDDVEEEDDDDY